MPPPHSGCHRPVPPRQPPAGQRRMAPPPDNQARRPARSPVPRVRQRHPTRQPPRRPTALEPLSPNPRTQNPTKLSAATSRRPPRRPEPSALPHAGNKVTARVPGAPGRGANHAWPGNGRAFPLAAGTPAEPTHPIPLRRARARKESPAHVQPSVVPPHRGTTDRYLGVDPGSLAREAASIVVTCLPPIRDVVRHVRLVVGPAPGCPPWRSWRQARHLDRHVTKAFWPLVCCVATGPGVVTAG
jgi:hypothetical protein